MDSCNYNTNNKRTLKGRVRKILSMCIFITIVFISSAFTFILGFLLWHQLSFKATDITKDTSQYINSSAFLKDMGIKKLEDFNANSKNAKKLVNSLRAEQSTSSLLKLIPNDSSFSTTEPKSIIKPEEKQSSLKKDMNLINDLLFNQENLVFLEIILKDDVIYSNRDAINKFIQINSEKQKYTIPFPLNMVTQKITNLFKSIDSTVYIKGENNKTIGTIHSGVDLQYLSNISIVYAVAIVLLSFITIFLGNIFGKLLTMPISRPLQQLENKLNDLADGDIDNAINTGIDLKRPLREIELLLYSTNRIMFKMKDYRDDLISQKIQVESTNEELEAQNEELTESKNLILIQQNTLEAQNEELEAQNNELIESKKKIEDAQTLLVQSENLASIGQLTAAITHEINTPLGAISSNNQLFKMLLDLLGQLTSGLESEEINDLISQLKETNQISLMASNRVSDIIKSLKSYSRLDQSEFQEADLNTSLQSVLILTSNLWKNKIIISEEYDENLKPVRCFSGLLNQVFMNILVNAIQAIPDKGNITIKTGSDEKYAIISIKDNGTGIEPQNISRLFEYGYTTKQKGSGMGIGLAICKNIIDKHEGSISVTSTPGEGAEFVIKIPLESTVVKLEDV